MKSLPSAKPKGALLISSFCILTCLFTSSPQLLGQDTAFRRGDSNVDGSLDLTDAVALLFSLFVDDTPLHCEDAADSNDDGSMDISDAVFTMGHLFLGGDLPPEPGLECGVDPTPDTLGCESYWPCQTLPTTGQSSFETPLGFAAAPGGIGVDDRSLAEGAGVPDQAAPPSPAANSGAPERDIEESDIFKLDGNLLFVLNRYRGLQVLQIDDLDHPRLVGQVPIFGYPQEMYVRGGRAYVIVSDFLRFSVADSAISAPIGFYGSQLRIVDLTDPTAPQVTNEIDIQGQYDDSRIVGDILYVVSKTFPNSFGIYDPTEVNTTQILSIDIGDPANIQIEDNAVFPRDNGWEHHLHVTSETMYLAEAAYDQTLRGYKTNIRAIDISDPNGIVRVGDQVVARGRIPDRWAMDEYNGVLRAASSQNWGNGDVYLTNFLVADSDDLVQIGDYTLHVNESLTAARFDGPRGYVVTYRNIDPLFAFDLSNAAEPRLLGELKVTGWMDFLVPLGDRLIALGHEDLVAQNGRRDVSLAVSLVDVSEDVPPQLLSRVTVGENWGSVPAERDDFAKVFRVLSEEGLLLFPFQSWDWSTYLPQYGVQLVDFDSESLTKRGLIEDGGRVERGIPHIENTVMTLSNEVFQTVDISNRDEPKLRGRLDLARNVQNFGVLPGGAYSVQLTGDWYLGDLQLIVTPVDDPNAAVPVAKVSLAAPYGRMFLNGPMAYVVNVREIRDDETQYVTERLTEVQVVDLSDPTQPELRGSVTLPTLVWPSYSYWYWGYGDEVVQVNGSTLAFHRYRTFFFREAIDCLGCWDDEDTNVHSIFLVDLDNPDDPKLASTVTIDDANWAWGLKAFGSTLYLSSYTSQTSPEGQWFAKYYLHRIDVSDPASPQEYPKVNIPGMLVSASLSGDLIYTLENRWDSALSQTRNVFYTLTVQEDKAYLLSNVELPGYLSGIEVEAERGEAVTVSQEWKSTTNEDGSERWFNEVKLLTLDLSDPMDIQLAGKADIPVSYAFLRTVQGGRAFVGSQGGIFSYEVSDIENPTFEAFFRLQGWPQDIVVFGDRAYLPSGWYGVQVLNLVTATR